MLHLEAELLPHELPVALPQPGVADGLQHEQVNLQQPPVNINTRTFTISLTLNFSILERTASEMRRGAGESANS